MKQPIESFTGHYSFLSNFHPSPLWGPSSIVSLERVQFPTGEHLFQAAKAESQAGSLRADWEARKRWVMLEVLLAKFTQHPDLARMLAATSGTLLVEGNTWHDNYWGDCHCGRSGCLPLGQNWLGRLLMMVREVIS